MPWRNLPHSSDWDPTKEDAGSLRNSYDFNTQNCGQSLQGSFAEYENTHTAKIYQSML